MRHLHSSSARWRADCSTSGSRWRRGSAEMRAVFIEQPGGPEVLKVREQPSLASPFGHVRVRVRYAGVNRADLLQRLGMYPAPPGVPADVPGLEYSGVVDALGEGVTQLAKGDRVFGL